MRGSRSRWLSAWRALLLATFAGVVGCATTLVDVPSASNPVSSAIGTRPLDAPQPRLRTVGHRGTVWRLDFSSDGRRLYSAGADKVVRVWDVAEKRQVAVFRIPVWLDLDGQIYGIDVSPDDARIGVGGCQGCGHRWDEADSFLVYVLDARSGEILGLASAGESVHSLAFSPDGRLLAAGGGFGALHLWRVEGEGELVEEAVLTGHGGAITDLAWLPDGRGVVSASQDGLLALWTRHPAGGWFAEWAAAGHAAGVTAVDVTPDGRWIVSGAKDGSVRVWDAKTGEARGTLVQLVRAEVQSLAVSPSGEQVAYGSGAGIWDETGVGIVALPDGGMQEFRKGADTAHAVAWSPAAGGPIVAAEGDLGTIALLGDDLEPAGHLESGSDPVERVLSRGRSVGWRLVGSGKDVVLDTARWQLHPGVELPRSDEPSSPVLAVGRVRGQPGRIQLFRAVGTVSVRAAPDRIRSTAILGDWVAVATERGVFLVDSWGRRRRRCYAAEVVPQVLSSFDGGRILVGGGADQTLRFWRVEDGELLLSFFYDPSGEWVAWTPEGYYDSSPKGSGLLGFHVNRGAARSPSFFPAEHFPELHRPDRVRQALQPRSPPTD